MLHSANPREMETRRRESKLPPAPPELKGKVKAWRQSIEFPTYLPEEPQRNPMFLEKRVYQGSSGRVYPLPFIDRVETQPVAKQWQAIHLENSFIRVMILPELGGRIHVGLDKTSGYDFFYRQNVIKPALVGLAGPWISGGVEFNWPQHHRPATFMPVATEIEEHEDGSVTVWCSDHDPMLRMKGMHGVCLHPERAVVDLKVRLYNRTPYTQTFLWWANVATRVHEHYQSFFPNDVRFVADHAKRAVTSFPRSNTGYYGVDYPARARNGVPAEEMPASFVPSGDYSADDLSWYANIPVPTSYMVTGTSQDFFGGYDHAASAGVVHVADHHIAPGKKQWTWGNHEFGYAWDRSLTDDDGPYIELMAGVYTDNQPDFSYLAPWETKSFTQTWFPIRDIGVPVACNRDAALSLRCADGKATLGVYVTKAVRGAEVILRAGTLELKRWARDVQVGQPLLLETEVGGGIDEASIEVIVRVPGGTLIEYDPQSVEPASSPNVATEPLPPAEIATIDELYLTGLHLQQYRHATRSPEPYWREALRRDAGDSRVNNAVGLWHLQRGEFDLAAEHFRAAVQRLTARNPNPYDGEPFYNLGLAERFRSHDREAYDAFYKATWNAAWRAPARLALAEMDAAQGNWSEALDHVERALIADGENLAALNLRVTILRELDPVEIPAAQQAIRRLDVLDITSRWRDGIPPANGQERLDLAFDLLRSGQKEEACRVLKLTEQDHARGTQPIELFLLAQIEEDFGKVADATWLSAAAASVELCFPSRLEELCVLQRALRTRPDEFAPWYLLGNFLYDRRRHEEAITAWSTAATLRPDFATVWRNLGIGLFNVKADAYGARAAFEKAFANDPSDARVFYERDQLLKRTGEAPELRLAEFERFHSLVDQRDDLSVELATLYNQLDQPSRALDLLLQRHFQPWEGGEGLVLAQYVRAQLLLGQRALQRGDASAAVISFAAALSTPPNLSEARHLLASQSDIFYWLGVGHAALGDSAAATSWWKRATRQRGDFQQMSVRNVSEMTYWTAMAHLQLGDREQTQRMLNEILEYSMKLEATEPKIDYFATSLPAMLLFEEDLQLRNRINASFLRAQALGGLEQPDEADRLLRQVLEMDANHSAAADLLRQRALSPAISDRSTNHQRERSAVR